MSADLPISETDREVALRVLRALRECPERFLDKRDDAFGVLSEVRAEANRLIAAIQTEVRRRRGELDEEPRPQIDQPALPRGERRPCYICNATFQGIADSTHPRLCPDCAPFNRSKREQRADLSGRVAVLTGGRHHIGFAVGLKLLRAGAALTITTRFPNDAARRYAAEPDHANWIDRLRIHALDLRDLRAVGDFAGAVDAGGPVDILIHNAAQTIRRPPAFYAALVEAEERGPGDGAAGCIVRPGEVASSALAALVQLLPGEANLDPALFPRDGQGQALDLRQENSWTTHLGTVPLLELVETYCINALAPYLLLELLLPALRRSPCLRKFVVSVSAREGIFNVRKKGYHPHTNMAKAALNMLTRTAAADLASEGIYLTCVDPGFSSEQLPLGMRDLEPPLDAIDSAARILDPIFTGVNSDGQPASGVLLRHFRPAPW
jgi:NAD(P)-dependent dehydrogenase (short-subunit alcohol dehydrogenase family)